MTDQIPSSDQLFNRYNILSLSKEAVNILTALKEGPLQDGQIGYKAALNELLSNGLAAKDYSKNPPNSITVAGINWIESRK